MTIRTRNLEERLDDYGKDARSATKKASVGKLLGFGAVAAGGLFTAADAEADVVYSGIINATFNLSTINSSATNGANGFYFTSATAGRNIFGLFGNNRGPANSVGSTDAVWLAGGAAASGLIKANGTTFPASFVPFSATSSVSSAGSAASFVWVNAGAPGSNVIDPIGVGSDGTATAFFGFSFSNTASTGRNFGFGRVQVTTAGGLPTTATLIDFAYDNDGDAIHVRVIPEPATTGLLGLAALALGASGLRRYRKDKKTA